MQLNDVDARTVDFYLESRTPRAGGNGQGGGNSGDGHEATPDPLLSADMQQRLPTAAGMLELLNHMVAPEPPANLAARVIFLAENRRPTTRLAPVFPGDPPAIGTDVRPLL